MTTAWQHTQNKSVVQNTTMATWAGAIARALADYGVNDQALFLHAGIDYALVNQPAQRIPVADMTRLWDLAVTASGDHTFGLTVAEKVNLTTFHALGVAAMASDTVRQAGDIVTRFATMVSDGIDMQIRESANETSLVLAMQAGYPRFADASVEAALGAILRTAQQLIPGATPSRVTFQHHKPTEINRYCQFFGCPVSFAADCDGLHIDAEQLPTERLPTSSPQIAEANTALCDQYLAARQQQTSARVRQLLHGNLEQGQILSLQEVAAQLAMSERKLQRLLRDEAVQFRDLLDEVRGRLARQMLANVTVPIGHVADRLGFDSSSAFTRAFRRWHGVSPRAMRQSGTTPDTTEHHKP